MRNLGQDRPGGQKLKALPLLSQDVPWKQRDGAAAIASWLLPQVSGDMESVELGLDFWPRSQRCAAQGCKGSCRLHRCPHGPDLQSLCSQGSPSPRAGVHHSWALLSWRDPQHTGLSRAGCSMWMSQRSLGLLGGCQ
jgi:hypothetical protein